MKPIVISVIKNESPSVSMRVSPNLDRAFQRFYLTILGNKSLAKLKVNLLGANKVVVLHLLHGKDDMRLWLAPYEAKMKLG